MCVCVRMHNIAPIPSCTVLQVFTSTNFIWRMSFFVFFFALFQNKSIRFRIQMSTDVVLFHKAEKKKDSWCVIDRSTGCIVSHGIVMSSVDLQEKWKYPTYPSYSSRPFCVSVPYWHTDGWRWTYTRWNVISVYSDIYCTFTLNSQQY